MDIHIRQLEMAAELLKAIGHPVRLCIVKRLAEQGDCNVTFLQDCMGLPQSTVSTHLQKLRAAGIVSTSRQGLEVTYSLHNEQMKRIVDLLFPTSEENKHD
jgi:DNA-binding transcriptional ArsR family regulator